MGVLYIIVSKDLTLAEGGIDSSVKSVEIMKNNQRITLVAEVGASDQYIVVTEVRNSVLIAVGIWQIDALEREGIGYCVRSGERYGNRADLVGIGID